MSVRRYVRIEVTKFVQSIALRAGVIIQNRDHLFKSSPFAFNGVCHRAHLNLNAVAEAQAPQAVSGSAKASDASKGNTTAASTSKASRWAARAAGQASQAEPAPAEAKPQQSAGSKAARWAARAAGSLAESHTQTTSSPTAAQLQTAQGVAPTSSLLPPSSEPATGDDQAQVDKDATNAATLDANPEQQHAPVEETGKLTYARLKTPAFQYTGYVLDGQQPHGQGSSLWSNGFEYHGPSKKGIPHGSGSSPAPPSCSCFFFTRSFPREPHDS
jgi:hypothetical protein